MEFLEARFLKHHRGGPVIAGEFRIPWSRHHVTALTGASGSGKTTLLRCLAGLDRPDEGRIVAGEEVWFDAAKSICLPPQRRRIGFLFQEYALFPHLRVAENIAYGIRHLPAADRGSLVREQLERFGIADLATRRIREISGGQQQRVALARALAAKPRLLLLDEPLSALDRPLRVAMRGELKRQLAGLELPVVLVTHDPEEAEALSDEILAVPMVKCQVPAAASPDQKVGRPGGRSEMR